MCTQWKYAAVRKDGIMYVSRVCKSGVNRYQMIFLKFRVERNEVKD